MPFPISRPVVFPLFGVTNGACACGNSGCTRIGKHAAVNWRDVEYGSAVPRPAPGAGVAIRTGAHPKGSDCFVVDLDGEAAALLFDGMGPCPDTFTVRTPRAGGGWHLYFRHPGFHVKTSSGTLGPKIDIRGDGGIVVAPGSPHELGGTYEIADDLPLADAPEWLLAWLRTQQAPTEAQHYPGDVTEPVELERRRGLYAEYLKHEAPARGPERRGQGDVILFDVVQRGAYDLALPVEDVLELVEEHYDPRCSPQWGEQLEERVHHKAHDAKTTSTRPRAEPLPEDLAHLAGAAASTAANDAEWAALAQVPAPVVEAAGALPAEDDVTATLEASLKITWGGWDQPLPPPVYMISPMVPEKTIGLIVAKGSSLKTWLVLSMLAAVSRGKPWLDTFPAVQCPTLLVDFESGRDIIHERMQYLGLADTPHLGIASFPNARLDDQAFWISLAKVCLARGVRLVAVDSFAAGATGVEENDANAAAPLHLATRFVEATGCAIVFIHHAKKGEGGDERDIVRGSGAIFGAADWVYTMIPQDEDRTTMLVRNIKAFRKKADDFAITLGGDGLVLDKRRSDSDLARAEELQQAVRNALLRGPVASKKLLDKAMGKKSGTCSAELDGMIARREVVMLPPGGYTLDYPSARLDRLRAACLIPGISNPGTLASAAHVDVEEVHALLASRGLVRSGTGYLMP